MGKTQAFRRALAGLCAVGCLIAFAVAVAERRSTATALQPVHQDVPEGKFSAEFPSVPVRAEHKLTSAGVDLVMIAYQTETAKESVGVTYIDYPKGHDLSLDRAAEASATKAKGTIQSKSATTFMGHPAMDVVVDADGAVLQVRLILRDRRLYTLLGASASGGLTSYDRLVKTFLLI
jgi:hypothetical protein